jgi:hypothetical protein
LAIFKLYNSNGGRSLVIQHDNLSGAKPNEDQHEEIFEKYKISPKHKARMVVPLCRMVPMLIVSYTFKIDILKMELAFHIGYKEGDKVFYLSPMNWKDEERMFLYTIEHGMNIGLLKTSDLKTCYRRSQT